MASSSDDPVQPLVDRRIPAMRQFVDRVNATLMEGVTEEAVRERLFSGTGALMDLLDFGRVRVAKNVEEGELGALALAVMSDSAGLEVEAGVGLAFDLVDPIAVGMSSRLAEETLLSLEGSQLEAVQQAVTGALEGRLSPAETVRQIRRSVGLGPTETKALGNYRAYLESVLVGEVAPSEAFIEARWTLADSRFGLRGLDRAKIDRMVDRYSSLLRANRAERIARTEIMRYANAGRLESWQMAQRVGVLGRNVSKRWLTANDGNVCPICRPLEGEEWPLTGTVEAFRSSGALLTMQHPPAHAHCRCVLVLVQG